MGETRENQGEELTERQLRFVENYILDPNATRAYRKSYPAAGHKTAATEGFRLLRNPKVQEEIRAARKAAAKRTRITADRVLREIARIAFSDVSDIIDDDTGNLVPMYRVPIETRRAISGVKVKRIKSRRHGEGDVEESEVEYKFWNKMDALKQLCNHLGLAQEITPFDALIASLPQELAETIRSAIAGELSKGKDSVGLVSEQDG